MHEPAMSRARSAVNALNDSSDTVPNRLRRAEVLALIGIAESLETLTGAVCLDGAGETAVKTVTIYAQRMRATAESREDKRARCEATHRHSVQWPRSESGCPGEMPPRGVRPGEDAGGPCQ